MREKITYFLSMTILSICMLGTIVSQADTKSELTTEQMIEALYDAEESSAVKKCALDAALILTGEKEFEIYGDSWIKIGTYSATSNDVLGVTAGILGYYDIGTIEKEDSLTAFLQLSDSPTSERIEQNKTALKKLFLVAEEIKLLTENMDTVDTVIYIHDYICFELTYERGTADNAATCLQTGTADCGGYAGLFYILANNCGIKTVCRRGSYGSVKHIWNEILIDDEWLVVDVSTDDINNSTACCLIERTFYYMLGITAE